LDSEQTDKSDEFAKIVDYNYGTLTVNGLVNDPTLVARKARFIEVGVLPFY
jgi:hypothetical protein